jgi:hypothetical protein
MKRSQLSNLFALGALIGLASLASGQQDVPKTAKLYTPAAAALPSSVDKVHTSKASVLVIPESDIFRGVELSPAQREALSSNFRKAKFNSYAPKNFNPQDIAAQRLPSGELIVMMQQNVAPPTSPLALADPCAVADYSEDQVTALHKVLVAQLRSQGGNVNEFAANVPKDCLRRQMVYYMKAALVVAK